MLKEATAAEGSGPIAWMLTNAALVPTSRSATKRPKERGDDEQADDTDDDWEMTIEERRSQAAYCKQADDQVDVIIQIAVHWLLFLLLFALPQTAKRPPNSG